MDEVLTHLKELIFFHSQQKKKKKTDAQTENSAFGKLHFIVLMNF